MNRMMSKPNEPACCITCGNELPTETSVKRQANHNLYFLVMRSCFTFLPDHIKKEFGHFHAWRKEIQMQCGYRLKFAFDPADFPNPKSYADAVARVMTASGRTGTKAVFTDSKCFVFSPKSVKEMKDKEFYQCKADCFAFIEREYNFQIEEVTKSA